MRVGKVVVLVVGSKPKSSMLSVAHLEKYWTASFFTDDRQIARQVRWLLWVREREVEARSGPPSAVKTKWPSSRAITHRCAGARSAAVRNCR